MGRWMEVLRERPPQDEDYIVTRTHLIVAEIAPYALMYIAPHLGRTGRAYFPMLTYVYFRSGNYVDETLWLDAEQVSLLLEEFLSVRRICHYQEFVAGLNGPLLLEHWADGYNIKEFELYLDAIEECLQIAADNHYIIRLIL